MTSDWQFAFNGLTLGAGTDHHIQKVEGLDPPPIRIALVDRPEDHGSELWARFFGPRTVTIEGTTAGDSPADIDAKLTAFKRALVPQASAFPLEYRFAGADGRLLQARPTRARVNLAHFARAKAFGWIVEFIAADPRIYDEAEQEASLGPAPNNGASFPITFSLNFGGGVGGETAADNDGDIETYPVATITGPVTNPRLRHVGRDAFVQANLVLASGEELVIDFAARTIERGGVSYYSSIDPASSWWALDPGTNQVQFLGSGTASGTEALLQWRSAWT